MDRSLENLRGRLLVQCRPSEVDAVLDIVAEHDAGIVLTTDEPEPTVKRLRRRFAGPILCDANRYTGTRRKHARSGTHPAWCRRQRDLGLIPLTDSGYVAALDVTGLRCILRGAARQASPVIAVLPLAIHWFRKPAFCRALVAELNHFGVPIALVLEHDGDPFSLKYLLSGFRQLLAEARVPVLLLRCDLSAIGALCHGAHTAAVGTTSSLRHLYPAGKRGFGSGEMSTLVMPLLSYHHLSTCTRLFERMSDHDHRWPCWCSVCSGATPDRLTTRQDAYRHSLDCLLRLHRELFGRLRTRDQLVSAWHETCSHAESLHEELAQIMPTWKVPRNLTVWRSGTDDPLSRHVPTQPQPLLPRPARVPE